MDKQMKDLIVETALELGGNVTEYERASGVLLAEMAGEISREGALDGIAPYVDDPDLVMDEVKALLKEVGRLDMASWL